MRSALYVAPKNSTLKQAANLLTSITSPAGIFRSTFWNPWSERVGFGGVAVIPAGDAHSHTPWNGRSIILGTMKTFQGAMAFGVIVTI